MRLIECLALTLLSSIAFAATGNQATDQKSAELLSLSGSVLRADTRAPLPHVQVVVVGPSGTAADEQDKAGGLGALQSGTTTDGKGNFRIDNLKPGTYLLRASHAGMTMKTGTDPGMVIQLQPAHPQTITVLMLQAGAITGRIVNELGEPMQSVSVSAMRYAYSIRGRHLTPAQNTTTDDKGEYRLFGLKPGPYLVLAGGQGEAMQSGDDSGLQTETKPGNNKTINTKYAPAFYPNQTAPDQASPIVVKPGDEAQANFSLSRVPVHRISGKLIGLAQVSPKDSEHHVRYVTAMRQGMELQSSMASVKKDFSFDISAVMPGKYKLIAIDTDMTSQSVTYGSKDVVVDSSDVTGVTIALNTSKGQIHGVIRPDAEAMLDLSRLYVGFIPASEDISELSGEIGFGAGGYAKVEKDGSFKSDVMLAPNPVYAIVAAQSGGLEDWYTSKVLLNGKDVTDSGFRLADAQGAKLEIVISVKGGTLEGTAVDSERKPFSNAQIIALPSALKLRKRFDLLQKTTADVQGHFKLRGVRPGEYIVMALEDAQEQPFMEDAFLKHNVDKMRTVKVGESNDQIQLQAIPAEE
jgi:hypothetical protein